MFYRFLIDVVVVFHGLFIVYVTFGGCLTWRWPKTAWIHLPMCCWAVLISVFQWSCPLTHVENWLRHRSETASLQGGFIDHYLTPIIYPTSMGSYFFVMLGLLLITINLIIYGKTYLKYKSHSKSTE